MCKRQTLVLVVLALGLSSIGEAQDSRWIRIDRTSQFVLYVDKLRTRPVDSTTVDAWTSWEFTTPQILIDKRFDRMVSLLRLDCRATRSMQIEANYYYGKTFVAHTEPPESLREWASAPSQSVNETLIIRGCLIARGQPTEPVK